MQTRAEFLKELGEGFSRFDSFKVARFGCLTGLTLALLAIAGGVAGLVPADPIFPTFFRVLGLTVFSGVLLVFLIFAALETMAEKRARQRIEGYVSGGGADLETLLEMATARKDRFPGSQKVLELLEEARAKSGSPS